MDLDTVEMDLSYRLYLTDQKGIWRPIKRVSPSSNLSKNRKIIYEKRIELVDKSFEAYKSAIEHNDFSIIPKDLKPLISDYNKKYNGNRLVYFVKRVFRKLKRIMKSMSR